MTSIASALYLGAPDRGGVDGLASLVVRYVVEDEERHVKLVEAPLKRIQKCMNVMFSLHRCWWAYVGLGAHRPHPPG